jgi:hypothetical protein
MDDTPSPGALGLLTRPSRVVYRRDLLARVLGRASIPA